MPWEKHARNEVLKGHGFCISYNPDPNKIEGVEIPLLTSDFHGPETAIVIYGKDRHIYLILNGDFRAEYEAAFPGGLKACLHVYAARKPQFGSTWTTGGDIDSWLKQRISDLEHKEAIDNA